MPELYIHPAALVESSDIGPGTKVWAFAHVLKGARIGRNCNIGDHVFIEGGAEVGDNVTVKNYVCLWDGVQVEDDVFIGPHATFTNDVFPRSPRMKAAKDRYARKANWLRRTLVERGCSIGANATILAGVTLGHHSMIGAGATVIRDVAPYALVVGTPARTVGFVCPCGERHDTSESADTCPQCSDAKVKITATL
jgi:acetyltransferase-like isoleucine patch superfamily enzyme